MWGRLSHFWLSQTNDHNDDKDLNNAELWGSGIGDRGSGIGDWGLGIGDRGLGIGESSWILDSDY